MWIAFVLMGITSVILVTGALIMWYRHRHSTQSETREDEVKGQKSKVTEKESVKRSDSENNSVSNGHVRHSGNESPVKSRIPVRAKVKQS